MVARRRPLFAKSCGVARLNFNDDYDPVQFLSASHSRIDWTSAWAEGVSRSRVVHFLRSLRMRLEESAPFPGSSLLQSLEGIRSQQPTSPMK
ncbi:hypothetical protein MRX96_044908 [Rhipicephalus microplus]